MPGMNEPQMEMLADGSVVESSVLNVVERIMEIWPNLKVKYLDPDRTENFFEAPYIVVEVLADGTEVIVMQVWELDDRLIDKLFAADISRYRTKEDFLKQLDEKNALVRRAEKELQKQQDEAIVELVTDVVKTPKDTYTATNPLDGRKHKFTKTPRSD